MSTNFTFLKRSLFIVLGLFFSITAMSQVTSSSIKGTVRDNNEGLPGATVLAVNKQNGAKYGTVTRPDGNYNIPSVSAGTYTIFATYVGYGDMQQEVTVQLGEEAVADFLLADKSSTLDEVTVKADKNFNSDHQGAEQGISTQQISALPSVKRNLSDFTRLTPQVRVDGNGAVSVAGQNNRFNSVYVDGAVNNDVFGLSASGTNGGQTGISPISVDAIEQFKVVISPYDVSLSGFTGGGINAITRSGSNTFNGSAYYFFRNQNLAGLTPGTNTDFDNPNFKRQKYPDFNSYTTGFRLGGPLVKDKLFFFVNAELQKDNSPNPYNFSTYQGKFTQSQIDDLRSKLISSYGYDPGDYTSVVNKLNAHKFVGKLDWNINQKNKISLSSRYSSGESTSPSRSSNSQIVFGNGGILFPSKTLSSSLEWTSTINNNLSNKLLFGYTTVDDNRNPMGGNFPYVDINQTTTGDRIIIGSEPFSTANQLKSKIFTFNEKLDYFVGKNSFSFGVDGEFGSFYNLFIRQNFGAYTYNTLDDFLKDNKPARYQRSYSLVDNVTGDGSKAAADFKANRYGFYAQDKIDITPKFSVSAGLRLDINLFPTKPFVDDYFNNTAAAIIQQQYNLDGAKSGAMPSGKVTVTPRFGFNWDINGDRTFQLRGGSGLFLGRVPMVWPGGVYTNSGVIIGGVNVATPNIKFESDVNKQYTAESFGATAAVPSGEINLISKSFRLPEVWRSNIGLDKRFGSGWGITLEGIFSKNINDVKYTNVGIDVNQIKKTAGPDVRNVYNPGKNSPLLIDLDPNKTGVQNPYNGSVFLMENADKSESGYSYNLTAKIDKSFSNGFMGSLAYTFGKAYVLNEATSSQNSSQWRYMETVNGRNFMTRSFSDFDPGSRIVGFVAYKFNYMPIGSTQLSLFYTGQTGNRFSYVYRNSIVNDRAFTEANDLIFVPKTSDQIVFADAATAAAQWTALDAYISKNEYLNSRRGMYVDRNGSRTPFTNVFDFKLTQDFYIMAGDTKHTFQFTWDIFNVGNLLSKKWGRQYFVSNDNYSFLTFNGFKNATAGDYTPTFTFTNPTGTPYNISDNATGITSRWTSQIGLRYIFN